MFWFFFRALKISNLNTTNETFIKNTVGSSVDFPCSWRLKKQKAELRYELREFMTFFFLIKNINTECYSRFFLTRAILINSFTVSEPTTISTSQFEVFCYYTVLLFFNNWSSEISP